MYRFIAVLLTGATLLTGGLLAAATPAMADSSSSSTISAAILPGPLTLDTSGDVWRVVDARGSGEPWHVTVSASDLTSPTGPTLPASVMRISVDSVALADSTSDPTDGIIGAHEQALDTSPVTVLDSPDHHMGSYSFIPSVEVNLPPGSPNDYQVTLTVTIS